jgi:hypothetical protein
MSYARKPRKKTTVIPQKEGSVMKAVSQWLALRKIPHWRINSGGLKDKRGRLVRFGAPGMSDFYAVGSAGISIWIECKRPSGGVLSAAQKEFLDCINRHGGIGIVVDSIESLEIQLKEAFPSWKTLEGKCTV